MKFAEAIDLYIADMRTEGRINSPATETNYRITLNAHADDVSNRDPRTTSRDDVKRTLARWPHPNTQRKNRSILVSFYRWAMEEGHRKDNPAEQTRRPRGRKAQVYRMTLAETTRFLAAAHTARERRVAYLGTCAGIRNAELRGLQGRHFQRPGWIWISADIAKGGKERWIPVIEELEPVVAEIRRNVNPACTLDPRTGVWVGEHVIPAERWSDPGRNTARTDIKQRPASRQVIRTVVEELRARAGIHGRVTPHSMRHAFGDHIARYAGIKNAQALLGHADVATTQIYTGEPTLDELAAAIRGFRFDRTNVLPLQNGGRTPLEARTGIEPVNEPVRPLEPNRTLTDVLLELRGAFIPLVHNGGGVA
jgi:integrase/recombinase XerD